MKKFYFLIATASLMLSCSQEDITSNFEKLPINLSVGQQTRANDSTYENEDEVGIYVVNYDGSTAGTLAASGNQVDNERFTYNNGAWTPDETIYWKDQSTAADFYAYYPYSESVNISAHPFSVMADQSTEDNFWASDFLWGKAAKVTPTSAAVPIVTNHSLSRIIVNVKPGNGFTEEAWAAATKSVKVCDVVTSATIDLSIGTATATGDKGEIIPLLTDGVYKAMLVPQEVADNSKLVVVTVDGVDYVYRKGYTFKCNTQHTFTITVNKKGGNVDVTIGEWEMDDFVNIGNAEEEEATIPNNQLWYTATAKVEPTRTDVWDATIVSNEWDSTTGKGVFTFEEDLTSIGSYAFAVCSFTDVTIPNSVTEISDNAFYNCENLTSINIPANVTSIGYCAFLGCGSLIRVDISDLSAWYNIDFIDTTANPLCNGAKLYLNNNEVTEITIPSDITKIGYTFTGCGSLTKVNISDSVTEIAERAFYYCESLTSVNIPDSVTSIGSSAFGGCSSLTRVDISDLSAWCKIDFSNNANPLCNGAKLYLNNNEVAELAIPSDITEIKSYAFQGYNSLTSINIHNRVTSIGGAAFYGCSSLTSINIPDSITKIEFSTFNDCSSLTSITIPNSVTEIGTFAFNGCSSLISITIPEGVTSIEASTFKGCSSLTSIIIPNSVTKIGSYAFRYCSSLTNVTIPDGVTQITDSAFADCSSLKEVYCKPTTPPLIYQTFVNNASDRKIYVPRNSVDAYKSATNWRDYADYIVGYDF